METADLKEVKTQLTAYLADLKERRANPFRGTPLEGLSDEIRSLRKTYALSYKEIADKLGEFGIQTSAKEITQFCRVVLKTESRPAAQRPAARP